VAGCNKLVTIWYHISNPGDVNMASPYDELNFSFIVNFPPATSRVNMCGMPGCSLQLLLCENQFSIARDAQSVFLTVVQNYDFTQIAE